LAVVTSLLGNKAKLFHSKDQKLSILKMVSFPSDWKQDVTSQVFELIVQKLLELHDSTVSMGIFIFPIYSPVGTSLISTLSELATTIPTLFQV
jgi:hypothetical protein